MWIEWQFHYHNHSQLTEMCVCKCSNFIQINSYMTERQYQRCRMLFFLWWKCLWNKWRKSQWVFSHLFQKYATSILLKKPFKVKHFFFFFCRASQSVKKAFVTFTQLYSIVMCWNSFVNKNWHYNGAKCTLRLFFFFDENNSLFLGSKNTENKENKIKYKRLKCQRNRII